MAKINVYELVTDRICAELEKGRIPWRKPWIRPTVSYKGIKVAVDPKSCAYSRSTGRPYSMLNQMLLRQPGEWATYNQIAEAGGKVKRGEKASVVVFWSMFEKKETDRNGDEVVRRIPILKYFNVFHVETLTESLGDRAYYRPSDDSVTVPTKAQFKTPDEFYSTLFHELTHSTGHKTRLDRFSGPGNHSFGGDEYSREELVAELGASALVNFLGLETEGSFRNNAAYIQSWLQHLRDDPKLIVTASSKDEKAVNYILTGELA